MAAPAISAFSASTCALIKATVAASAPLRPFPINLAVCVDLSGSMYETNGTDRTRLERVQNGLIPLLKNLSSEDRISLVGFGYDAQVVLPSTKIADSEQIERAIRKIDCYDVDPGGTRFDLGLQLAMDEVESHSAAGRLSQILVLTDGQVTVLTSSGRVADGCAEAEEECRRLAIRAARKKISVVFFGIGVDWDAPFIKELARLAEGRWYYIDVEDGQSARKVLAREFEILASTTGIKSKLYLWPAPGIEPFRAYAVGPEVRKLPFEQFEDGCWVASLGALRHGGANEYLLSWDLSEQGSVGATVGEFEITYASADGERCRTGRIPLQRPTNDLDIAQHPELTRALQKLEIFQLNNRLQNAILDDDLKKARRLASELEDKTAAFERGAKQTTKLVQEAAERLQQQKRPRKKTMLALDDSAQRHTSE